MTLILQKGVNNMKDYINQINEEGLGKSIYVPLKKMIDKNTMVVLMIFLLNKLK